MFSFLGCCQHSYFVFASTIMTNVDDCFVLLFHNVFMNVNERLMEGGGAVWATMMATGCTSSYAALTDIDIFRALGIVAQRLYCRDKISQSLCLKCFTNFQAFPLR